MSTRIIARLKARELTPAEIDQVAGGENYEASFAPTETVYTTNVGPAGDKEKQFDY
jgi:hypothetical protein